ncbi:MAG: class I SAM-dependent methyltransferase [Oscillospiraceae bacterium]|nr:class I SAM-dependent methyltransferase [Oscillospiraceae bacterium]
MKLDSRLALCADMVQGDYICDIGTDHGYLPAYLLSTGKCSRALCSDINPLPLGSSEENLNKEGVAHMAQFRLSNGFESLDITGVTDIVIAGMGGETIAEILSNEKSRCPANFILQPMSRAEILRDYLAANGFEVTSERAAVCGGFAYAVMSCKFTGTPYIISPERRITGLLSKDDPASRELVSRQISRIISAVRGLINSSDMTLKSKGENSLSLAEKIRSDWGFE